MAVTRFADHILPPDDHASRPAAGTVPEGTLYPCTDHDIVYQSDGASWSDWFAGGSVADVVQVASGFGNIRIPGLAGSEDIVPSSPGGSDDEFDVTDASDPLTGWTTMGSPAAHDINSTVPSHYYLRGTAASVALEGIYKASPSTPFTMTAKITDCTQLGSPIRFGIFISPSPLAAIESISRNGANIVVDVWASRTSFSGQPALHAIGVNLGVLYLRIVATTSSNVAYYYSLGGQIWTPLATGRNPGFTIGLAGVFVNANGTSEMTVDYVRFT